MKSIIVSLLLILISCNSKPSSGEVVDDDTNMVAKISSVYIDSGAITVPIQDTIYYRSTNYGEQSKKPFGDIAHLTDTSGRYKFGGTLIRNTAIDRSSYDTLPDDYRISTEYDSGDMYIMHSGIVDTGRVLVGSTAKYDTVRVILLVCDTGYYKGVTTMVAYINGLEVGKSVGRITSVWWQFGYELREFVSGHPMVSPYWKVIEYLSNDKKKLPKNIVIWQSQTLK